MVINRPGDWLNYLDSYLDSIGLSEPFNKNFSESEKDRCMMKKFYFLLFVCCFLFTVNFAVAAAAEPAGKLQATFADAKWDGKTIPYAQQCGRDNGKGATPPLSVKNIPAEANTLIFEYSDRSYAPMDNGGHGKIGYSITPGVVEVTVPAVPGHTFSLPEGFFLISAQTNPSWDKAGAYLPPCSGGRGNYYYVTIKAVIQSPDKSQKPQILATTKLEMGRY